MTGIRFSEIIRGWLGWCPHRHMMNAKANDSAGSGFRPADPVVRIRGPSGADGSGKPWELLYEHTQRGLLIIGTVTAVLALMIALTFLLGFVWITGLVACILVFALAICSTLTASVSNSALRIRFGPLPLIRKSWPVDLIASATPVTNPWYYGWGIRWTPSGPLYNVSGYGAVEVTLHSGTRFRIGTDEPEELCRAIEQARNNR